MLQSNPQILKELRTPMWNQQKRSPKEPHLQMMMIGKKWYSQVIYEEV
jgi:hypothetical protein